MLLYHIGYASTTSLTNLSIFMGYYSEDSLQLMFNVIPRYTIPPIYRTSVNAPVVQYTTWLHVLLHFVDLQLLSVLI